MPLDSHHAFLVTSPVTQRQVWNVSLTHAFLFWSNLGLRLGMRRKNGLIWGLWKAVICGVRDLMPPEALTVQQDLGLHLSFIPAVLLLGKGL